MEMRAIAFRATVRDVNIVNRSGLHVYCICTMLRLLLSLHHHGGPRYRNTGVRVTNVTQLNLHHGTWCNRVLFLQ